MPLSKTENIPSPKLISIQTIFNRCFVETQNTRLLFGALEPFYKVADAPDELNTVYSREYIEQSALHEIAHFCLAGAKRRKQDDYGYWYAPDGRNAAEQREFYKVEVKPQALEAIFSNACGVTFSVSADNLAGQNCEIEEFKKSVETQKEYYLNKAMPKRAALFLAALKEAFKDRDAR
jgi:hypothetical protein